MKAQLWAGLRMFLVISVLTGVGYPLLVTGISQVVWADNANGSVVAKDGVAVGSNLLAQPFTAAKYFHPRPSAAGKEGYDALASAGSNLGPTNDDLIAAVAERTELYRAENGLDSGAKVPVDAVTASGSGLDPDISVANALLQAGRVARERYIPVEQVKAVVLANTSERTFGFLGEPSVNVLQLNLALDNLTT